MWNIVFIILGILMLSSALYVLSNIVHTSKDIVLCTPKFSEAKVATNKTAMVHSISKIIVSLFVFLYGVAKVCMVNGADLGFGKTVRILFDSGLLANGIDIVVTIYTTIKHKLISTEKDLKKTIINRILTEDYKTLSNGQIEYDFKVLQDVKRVTNQQYFDVAIISILLMTFAFVI